MWRKRLNGVEHRILEAKSAFGDYLTLEGSTRTADEYLDGQALRIHCAAFTP
jgi:hypothetical protein